MKNRLCFAVLVVGLLASVLVWDRSGSSPRPLSNDNTTGAQSFAVTAASAELSQSAESSSDNIGVPTGATNLISYGQEFWRRRSVVGERPGSFALSEVIERVSHAISPLSTTPTFLGERYSAAFSDDGLQFSPHRPGDEYPEPDPATVLTIRTISVCSGAETLYASAGETAHWSIVGNTAQRSLGSSGLFEHFETAAEGVELSWVLGTRTDVAGLLAIEADCAGLSYLGRTEQGMHFADEGGTPRVRIGNAKVVDSAGREWDVPTFADANRLRVEVAGAIIAAATFPIAVDPLISPEFGLGNPVLVPAQNDQDSSAVAFNGSVYLATWHDRRLNSLRDDIFAARIATDGVLLDPYGIRICSASGQQVRPVVANSGSQFLIAWRDYRSGARAYAARVTGAGELLDEDGFEIGGDVGQTRFETKDIGVAGNSNGYLVVWTDKREQGTNGFDIYGSRITPAGAVLNPNGFPISRRSAAQEAVVVAGNGTDFLVAWEDRRNTSTFITDIYGSLVRGDGTVVHPGGLALSTAVELQRDIAIGYDGSNFFVVWSDGRESNRPDIFGTRVTTAGQVLDPSGLKVIEAGTGSGPFVLPSPGTASRIS